MQDLLQVGTITSTHGLRGEVKVFPTTDDVKRFKQLKEVMLDTGKEQKLVTLTIEGVKFFKQFAILKFKDLDRIEEIEAYKGKNLYVTREQAVPLEKGEYYIADLIDLPVYLEDGSVLGTLTDVLETGANDVYVITDETGEEILIPAIAQCIRDIDLTKKKMTIHLMEGLR